MADVTQLCSQIEQGDPGASEQLLPLVYAELRRLAAKHIAGERPGQTLDATALVHEAYLRLVGGQDSRTWAGRRHFYAAAAQAMRRILVDRARHKNTIKKGSGRERVDLDAVLPLKGASPLTDLIALDEALDKLNSLAPEKAELVRLRFFLGLTTKEAADTLGISVATADRHWSFARSWLYAELQESPSSNP